MTETTVAPDPPMDLSEALERIDGDRELLMELLGIFLADCPQHMDALGEAAASKDCGRLAEVAHLLKGSLRVLGAGVAATGVERLEALGRSGRCDGAEAQVAALAVEVRRLLEFIAAELSGSSPALSADHRRREC